MFQNPKTRSGKIYGDSDWHSIYNKYQITSGLHYQKDKWSADLMTNLWGTERQPININVTLNLNSLQITCSI